MLTVVLPPSPEIARCRIPEHVKLYGIGGMGTAAWKWMAMWCPRQLAAIDDPETHFKALDKTLWQILKESEIHIADELGVTDLNDPEQMGEPQEIAWEKLRRDWIEVCKEEPTPVWDPEWAEFEIPYGENLWGRDEGLPLDMVATEVFEHIGPVKLWWPREQRQRQRELQQIIHEEMSPLGRHLTFDMAARMARRMNPPRPEMIALVTTQAPPTSRNASLNLSVPVGTDHAHRGQPVSIAPRTKR